MRIDIRFIKWMTKDDVWFWPIPSVYLRYGLRHDVVGTHFEIQFQWILWSLSFDFTLIN